MQSKTCIFLLSQSNRCTHASSSVRFLGSFCSSYLTIVGCTIGCSWRTCWKQQVLARPVGVPLSCYYCGFEKIICTFRLWCPCPHPHGQGGTEIKLWDVWKQKNILASEHLLLASSKYFVSVCLFVCNL